MDSEWWRLDLPEHLGGSGAPASVRWAAWEMLLGANPAAFMYMSGPGFAAILDTMGTPAQKRWAELMIDHRWGATMVLTEPDAGSDVGAGRTRAHANDDGTWHLTGVKRFITSGEHDLADNIVHLVLARPDGAGPGTKGLSLFLVPKYHVNLDTGQIGARNGVRATNVEKKMGLKASTTCELTFGQNEPAVGWLVGDVHDGIAQMFKVIEYARMMVGTKAIAALSSGYLNALDYAKTRVQGPDLARTADKAAPRVAIMRHPDVRRMLMLQKSYTEGLRALVAYTAQWQDQTVIAAAAANQPDRDLADRVNNLLLPIVKGVGSERSYEMLALSLQTFGGSGFLQDYPIEQYLRDAKIDSLYEGTTAIQGMDLFFRKILRDQFIALTEVNRQMTLTAAPHAAPDRFAIERALLTTAMTDVEAVLTTMTMWAMASEESPVNLYLIGLNTTRLLMMLGDLLVGWLLLLQADIATNALTGPVPERDRMFYLGKQETAAWFARNRLPLLTAERLLVEGTTLALMDLPDDAF
jgi:alkylation response protein AidB-like acyl-CoA dehydrogenase